MYTDDVHCLDYELKSQDESHARMQVWEVSKFGILTGADGRDNKFKLKLEKYLESEHTALRAKLIELVKAEHPGIK